MLPLRSIWLSLPAEVVHACVHCSHLPYLMKFYFIPAKVRRAWRRLVEARHRAKDMSGLIDHRKDWVEDQRFLLKQWQVTGGSRVERAVQAGAAFETLSGVRQYGLQRLPVASLAPTQALSALTDDDSFLKSFSAMRSSKQSALKFRKQQKLLLDGKPVDDSELVPLLPNVPASQGTLYDRRRRMALLPVDDSGVGSPRRVDGPKPAKPPVPPTAAGGRGVGGSLPVLPLSTVTPADEYLDLRRPNTAAATNIAVKGTPLDVLRESSVAVSAASGMDPLQWRKDVGRYRWRAKSDGGQLPLAGVHVPTPESFSPEAFKPMRFRKRNLGSAVLWKVGSALRALTTSKIASAIQVRAWCRDCTNAGSARAPLPFVAVVNVRWLACVRRGKLILSVQRRSFHLNCLLLRAQLAERSGCEPTLTRCRTPLPLYHACATASDFGMCTLAAHVGVQLQVHGAGLHAPRAGQGPLHVPRRTSQRDHSRRTRGRRLLALPHRRSASDCVGADFIHDEA
jgi:hypothetical protein